MRYTVLSHCSVNRLGAALAPSAVVAAVIVPGETVMPVISGGMSTSTGKSLPSGPRTIGDRQRVATDELPSRLARPAGSDQRPSWQRLQWRIPGLPLATGTWHS